VGKILDFAFNFFKVFGFPKMHQLFLVLVLAFFGSVACTSRGAHQHPLELQYQVRVSGTGQSINLICRPDTLLPNLWSNINFTTIFTDSIHFGISQMNPAIVATLEEPLISKPHPQYLRFRVRNFNSSTCTPSGLSSVDLSTFCTLDSSENPQVPPGYVQVLQNEVQHGRESWFGVRIARGRESWQAPSPVPWAAGQQLLGVKGECVDGISACIFDEKKKV